MIKVEKKQLIKKLIDELSQADNFYFADFTGINAHDVTKLRSQLRDEKSYMRVVKNRLLNRVFTELNLEVPETNKSVFIGSTAVFYSLDDILVPARKIAEFAKEDVSIKFKGAFVEGRFLNAAEVERLASIPSREELLSQVVGVFEGVKSALVGVLQAKLQELTLVIDALRGQKEEQ
jgi:large subunit ribosomal protein L10